MKELELYTTASGRCPFLEWINKLDISYRVRINKRLNRMKDGNFGDWKPLKGSKLCEIRLDFGKGYRIYFKELDNIIILIIAGSDKSDQNAVIKQANKYFEDYLNKGNDYDNKI